MKKSILTVLFALCSTIGFAQVSFQVKAGLNLSSYIGENSDHSKFKPGARIGVGMEYQFTDLISLQPSLFFSQKGLKYSSGYEGTVVDADADVKINQLYRNFLSMYNFALTLQITPIWSSRPVLTLLAV